MSQKVILIGYSGGTHLAESLLRAAQTLPDPSARLVDIQLANQGTRLHRYINWHFLGKKPPNLPAFERQLLAECREFQPQCAIVTGISPVTRSMLQTLNERGIQTVNFLTDDPFNPVHYAQWFIDALPHYTTVFSPRRVLADELSKIGCADVCYLPFGYDPELFFPVSPTAAQIATYQSDVMFAGGGDADRVPYIGALIAAGLNVGLYGGYWDRYPATRGYSRGIANIETVRLAIHCTKVALCLVRRANRDGHVMRTFEVPAVGACMLTEDTPDHREIFGADGEAVLYFRSIPEMVEKAKWAIEHPDERHRLATAAFDRITNGHHTYADRLNSMLT